MSKKKKNGIIWEGWAVKYKNGLRTDKEEFYFPYGGYYPPNLFKKKKDVEVDPQHYYGVQHFPITPVKVVVITQEAFNQLQEAMG